MRSIPTIAVLVCVACGKPPPPPPEAPAWLAERAHELEQAAYEAAVKASQRPPEPFAVTVDTTCGADRFHAHYLVVEDRLDLEVTVADALEAAPVEARLGSRVAVHDATRWEDVNSIREDAKGQTSFSIERASTFLEAGAPTPTTFTVAWARRVGSGFEWAKRRTIAGLTITLQRPALDRFLAEPALASRLFAEERRLSEDEDGLGRIAREAERWPSARNIVDAYARLRSDHDRRRQAFTAEFGQDAPAIVSILRLGCR